MHDTMADLERQIEGQADLSVGRNLSEVFRQHLQIAFGPNQHSTSGAQILEVDPRRPAR
jgi:hypothetical protein